MSFFDSEVVRAEMTEIGELQEDVYKNVFKFPTMDKEEKIKHVGTDMPPPEKDLQIKCLCVRIYKNMK